MAHHFSVVYKSRVTVEVTLLSSTIEVFAIYQNSVGLDWVGKLIASKNKYCMNSNERHRNPRPEPNPRKFGGKND